ncbi:MAG TPA: acyltransferase, partial [Kiloniellales bacterium]|nr:acyltransferase [Kiloniellales bacterium]
MDYRPDIDGLRAVAIVPVLLFHAGVPGFSGGYVGVDVFFVISGYLITRLIAGEMESGGFSLLRFYERRARRILPALLLVLLACLPFAHLLLLPDQYADFADSIDATLGFVSNFYFFGQTGYFEDDVGTMPLLHTWTLAVEEQFYVVFPLLLLAMRRGGRRGWLLVVVLLFALSFATALYFSTGDAAFYLSPARAWELMLGSLLALLHWTLRSRAVAAALALVGLGMILAAVVSYDEATTPSSFALLLPCGGAALVILSGAGRAQPAGFAGSMLASRLPVAIGLISYSLYLWHWPVLVFLQLWLLPEPLGIWALPALALCFVLATLSWRYVER